MVTAAKKSARSTRDRILEVALELFSRQGYEATTTRQITSRLGITPAALYYHFRSKSACLDALVDPYLDAVEALISAYRRPVSGGTEARVLLKAYRQILVDNLTVARLVDGDAAVTRHGRRHRRVDAITAALRMLLAGPEADDDAVVRASAALGAIRRPTLRLTGEVTADEHVALDAALAALRPPAPAR